MKAKVQFTLTFQIEVTEDELGLDDLNDTHAVIEAIHEQFDEDPDMFINDYITSKPEVLDLALRDAKDVRLIK